VTAVFRKIQKSDQVFLWEMLYQAIYIQENETAPDRDILNDPKIAVYAENWGRANDVGLLAISDEANDKPIGAAWLRLLTGKRKGFGYINDTTPELSIALLPEYRRQGIGTKLLKQLLQLTDPVFDQICLSVDRRNPAISIYQQLGFTQYARNGHSLTMIRI